MQNKFYSVVAYCLCPLFFSQVLLSSYAMQLDESCESDESCKFIDLSNKEGNVNIIELSSEDENVNIIKSSNKKEIIIESSNKEENIPEIVNLPRHSFIHTEIRCHILNAYPGSFEYIKKMIQRDHLIHCFEHETDLKEEGEKKKKTKTKVNLKSTLIDNKSEKISENNFCENLDNLEFPYENLNQTTEKIKGIVEKEKTYSFSHHMEIMNEFLSSIILNLVKKNFLTEKLNWSDILKITQIEYLEFILRHAIAERALSETKDSHISQLIAFSLMYAFKHKLALDPKVLHLVESVRRISTIKNTGEINLDWKDNKKDSWEGILIKNDKCLDLKCTIDILLKYSSQNKKPEVLFGEKFIKNFEKTKICTSLDGGGSRGIFSITLLDILFKELEQEFHIHDLCQVFDLFAGTSTGGILALGLTCPNDVNKLQAKHTTGFLRKLYRELPNNIFTGSKWNVKMLFKNKYPYEPLEKKLKKILSKHLTIKEAVKPILITSVNITNGKKGVHTRDEDGDLKFWEVGRMTSAAPGFFEGYKDPNRGHTYIDGGIYQNNPSYLAYEKTTKEYPDCPILFLSLGTGHEDYVPVDQKVSGLNAVIKNGLNPLLKEKAETVEDQMESQLNGEGKEGQNYFRFNTILPFPANLDTTKSRILDYLEDSAIAVSKSDQWKLFVRVLINLLKEKGVLVQKDKKCN